MLRRTTAEQVLLELELLSVTAARAYVPVVSGSTPGTRVPTGSASAADYWREQLLASPPSLHAGIVARAQDELDSIRRRRFPIIAVDDGDDLRERIVDSGEGLPPADVAVALRCTPTLVRRVRLVAGRDAERGRRVTSEHTARELVRAGLSVRAAALATGVPRSTLSERLRAHHPHQ